MTAAVRPSRSEIIPGPAPVAPTLELVPAAQLRESKLNPRRRFNDATLAELAQSITEHGILTPLIARPIANTAPPAYELAAGHRRLRAAKLAKLELVPVLVREMSDREFLEVLTIENLQREDVHPLEEAQGFAALMKSGGYDAAKIAERVGRSIKYVYDRMKLLSLTKEAQTLFFENRITAGHAILLARLKPADQDRAIDTDGGGLFTPEATLFHPERDDREPANDLDEYKTRSVRELEGWIDKHVRLDPSRDTEPLIFPEIAEVLVPAKEMNLKVVPITHDHQLRIDARSEERTYSARAWKRADGKNGSKKCDYAVVGYIAAGPGRGEAFNVCINREKCAVHWPDQVKAAAKRAKAKKAAAKGGLSPAAKEDPKAAARAAKEAAREAELQAKAEFEVARWKKSKTEVLKTLATFVKKSSAARDGKLAEYIVGEMSGNIFSYNSKGVKQAGALISGKSAEDTVRYLAFALLADRIVDDWADYDEARESTKAIGFDLEKVLEEIAPLPKPEKPSPAKKKARR